MSLELGNHNGSGYPDQGVSSMSVNQYKNATFNSQDSLVIEQEALTWINGKLSGAKTEGHNSIAMISALHENRELWLCLMQDVASEENGLSKELKANIASLSLWVYQHCTRVLDGEGDVEDLIHVNGLIAEGLRQATALRDSQGIAAAPKIAADAAQVGPRRVSSEI